MNPYEEELQKNLESGKLPEGDDLDIKAYQHVFNGLKKAHEYSLPIGFAERVVAKAVETREKRGFSRDFLWFGIGLFLMVVACIVAIVYSGFKPSLGFLSGLADFKGLIIFGAVFIFFLNWLDKKLVRKNENVGV
jgi:hypothetical protein